MLPPGSTIGILGGGQLGRMAVLAAANLGYRVHIYTQETDSVAPEISAAATISGWHDQSALQEFAASVDVITLEFENVPVETVRYLSHSKPVFPSAKALSIAQDRVAEKTFLNQAGIKTAPWHSVETQTDLIAALAIIGAPSILKTARFGYDGKGQKSLTHVSEGQQAWSDLGEVPAILEGKIAFEKEISVVLARNQRGEIAAYPAVENHHRNGILHQSLAPAILPADIVQQARTIAQTIAEALDYVGVLAVEMFVTGQGDLLVNEMAPRPHNSGHWTMDACFVSQFEQQIRAVAGLPLGSTALHSRAIMTNLIGDDVAGWQNYVADPATHLHFYGKKDIRPGRKMGHVTKLLPLD